MLVFLRLVGTSWPGHAAQSHRWLDTQLLDPIGGPASGDLRRLYSRGSVGNPSRHLRSAHISMDSFYALRAPNLRPGQSTV